MNLFWSDDDGLWIADVPDLRGCMTHGHSRAEAVKNAAEAVEGWLETAREIGLDIPRLATALQSTPLATRLEP